MASKTHKEGRSAIDGRFTTIDYAKKHPKETVIERVPNPGFGDTNKSPKRKK